ncbi:MAG TPA: glutamine-hydrolyzing carbamoyl-phosphate synthase small subunit [Chloroflexota bacterium]|nr:glutamine-hydrolyzing carbamoyl-phosphate synthase small subunit [Chloroflexota bacterium]
MSEREAALALEDGSIFVGQPFGADVDAEGEVVFNTAMTGYQEISTDPSYRGQLVVLTHPQVGNYGVSPAAQEARRPWLAALLVRELADQPQHWESQGSLHDYLRRWGVPGVQGIDTRALTRRLRARGALRAVLRQSADGGFSPAELARLSEEARRVTPLSEKDLVAEVSSQSPAPAAEASEAPRVVLVDYGYKANIARSLQRRGAMVELLPWEAGADRILASRPDAVVLSNGPGDPAQLADAVRATQQLIPTGVPMMGICLGHQIIGQAAGASTSRLPFGHHGANHPVRELATGRVAVTSQNHEFQVEPGPALEASGFEVSHVSLNDGSVEGLRHRELPVFSVQFHPEGCPGPQDSQPQFDRLFELIARRRGSAG